MTRPAIALMLPALVAHPQPIVLLVLVCLLKKENVRYSNADIESSNKNLDPCTLIYSVNQDNCKSEKQINTCDLEKSKVMKSIRTLNGRFKSQRTS